MQYCILCSTRSKQQLKFLIVIVFGEDTMMLEGSTF